MLPTSDCIKPNVARSLMSHDREDFDDRVLMDQIEFGGETFQRVYQYLIQHAAGRNLDKFSYSKDCVEGTADECLGIFLRLENICKCC